MAHALASHAGRAGAGLSRTRNANRNRIMDSAYELFMSQGYAGTSMEGVARATQMSKATVYGYFPDKASLFVAMVREKRIAVSRELREATDTILGEVLEAISRRLSPEQIAPVLEKLFLQANERRADSFFRLLLEIAADQPSLLGEIRKASTDDSRPRFSSQLSERFGGDIPSGLQAETVAYMLLSTVIGYTFFTKEIGAGVQAAAPDRLALALAVLLGAAFAD